MWLRTESDHVIFARQRAFFCSLSFSFSFAAFSSAAIKWFFHEIIQLFYRHFRDAIASSERLSEKVGESVCEREAKKL